MSKPVEPPAEKTNLKSPKRWLAVRIVDYRLQALAPADPEDPEGDQDWADLGADTTFSRDREAIYQLCREHQGLLMSHTGLPGAARLKVLQARIAADIESAKTE